MIDESEKGDTYMTDTHVVIDKTPSEIAQSRKSTSIIDVVLRRTQLALSLSLSLSLSLIHSGALSFSLSL